MRRLAALCLLAACGGDGTIADSAEAHARCYGLNDRLLAECADDLVCRHEAYGGAIADCFDEIGCGAIATWLRCADEMQCVPDDAAGCVARCGDKPLCLAPET